MPRRKPKAVPARRGRKPRGFGLANTKPERPEYPPSLMALLLPALREATLDIRRQLDDERRPHPGWKMTEDGLAVDLEGRNHPGVVFGGGPGPTLALLQERLAACIEQTKKQFDRLSVLGDRVCGPGTQPAGDDSAKNPILGGAITILNAQLNALDRMMARVDDQIARLETL